MSDFISKSLGAAKDAISKFDNFDKSVAKQAGHEYSSVPYSLAHNAKSSGTTSVGDYLKKKLREPIDAASKDVEGVEKSGIKQGMDWNKKQGN